MKKKLIITSLIAAVVAMPAFADPTAQELLDQKTVTSKYYVDTTKQDKITTDRVLAIDPDGTEYDVYVPAIVTTNAAGTELNGNSIGILNADTLDSKDWGLLDANETANADILVPTVAAVGNELNYIYDELYTKQGVIPAGRDGDVVTYTGVEGEVGSVTRANAPIYDSRTGALSNGTHIATIAAVDTRQEKMTCAGYVPGHEGNLDYCWLYGEVQVACKQGNESCEYHGECCSNMCAGPAGNKTCSFNI